MTDFHPSEREAKAKKGAASSSFFRFLSKKSSNSNVNPSNAAAALNTARLATAAPTTSESKKSFQPPSLPIPSNAVGAGRNESKTKLSKDVLQRRTTIPPPVTQPFTQQQLITKLENLKVSTPPNAENFQVPPGRELRLCGSETGTDPLETINSKIKDVLYKNDNQRWTNFWIVIEEATQVKRENIAYVLVGICAVLSVWSSLGDFVCTFVGFAYPSVATYKILNPSPRSHPVSNAECIHWFRYWSIFAFIQCVDVVFGKLFAVFPPYQICKVLLFLATSYSHWNVSGFVYSYAVMPFVKWIKKFSDKYIFNK